MSLPTRIAGQTPMFPGAVVADGFVFTSGLVSRNCLIPCPATEFAEQARDVIDELAQLLDTCGSALDRVVSLTVYLADPSDFASWNELFIHAWPHSRPARTTVTTGFVAPNIRIEIAAIAILR